MRIVAALIVPVAALLLVLGSDVSVVLFGYGAATTEQAAVMGDIVSIFMLGLLPFTLFYVLLRGFYSLEDTRTPFFVTVAFSAVMLVLVLMLFSALTNLGVTNAGGPQVAAIALGYVLAYWFGLRSAVVVACATARRTADPPHYLGADPSGLRRNRIGRDHGDRSGQPDQSGTARYVGPTDLRHHHRGGRCSRSGFLPFLRLVGACSRSL